MFNRKPARLLNNGDTQKISGAADEGQFADLIGYHQELGPLGQPACFYVGIGFGIIFQAALVTISIAMY
jgi:hypothetical protein